MGICWVMVSMVDLPTRRADRTRLKDPSKRHAPKHERSLADKLGAKLTPGSGNQAIKGDLRIRGVARIEAKCTRRKSFSVSRDVWSKIQDAAGSGAEHEIPVLHVEFLDSSGDRECGLYILREEDVETLIQEAVHAHAVKND